MDLGTVTGALTGAISVLEAGGPEKKKYLQELKETFKTLIDVNPSDAKGFDQKSYEQFLERINKQIEA